MTDPLDHSASRPWHVIVGNVPPATPVNGLSAAPDPAASKVARYAQRLKRTDETPADVLAALEYEVSEPATRDALDTMRDWRATQRTEMERLDALEAPDPADEGPWTRRLLENLWTGLPVIAPGLMVLPYRGGLVFDVPVALSALAAIIATVRLVVVQTGRTADGPDPRTMLLLPTALIIATPLIAMTRVLLAGDSSDHGIVTIVGIAVQFAASSVFVSLTLRAPKLPELAARAAKTPGPATAEDAFYEVIEARIDALYEQVKAQAPLHLRAALAHRDPEIARASRHTIVDAIRVLHGRGEIDSDEAEWMMREALRSS